MTMTTPRPGGSTPSSTPAPARGFAVASTPSSALTSNKTPSTKTMGRLELLAWLNRTLQSDYASVQECGDGVAYCQLLDALHPGKVPLHALDYGAKYLSDNARNVRVLSRTMLALGLGADVDFEAVANGKFTVRLFIDSIG